MLLLIRHSDQDEVSKVVYFKVAHNIYKLLIIFYFLAFNSFETFRVNFINEVLLVFIARHVVNYDLD